MRFTQGPKFTTQPTDAAIAMNAKREKARERAAKKSGEAETTELVGSREGGAPRGHL